MPCDFVAFAVPTTRRAATDLCSPAACQARPGFAATRGGGRRRAPRPRAHKGCPGTAPAARSWSPADPPTLGHSWPSTSTSPLPGGSGASTASTMGLELGKELAGESPPTSRRVANRLGHDARRRLGPGPPPPRVPHRGARGPTTIGVTRIAYLGPGDVLGGALLTLATSPPSAAGPVDPEYRGGRARRRRRRVVPIENSMRFRSRHARQSPSRAIVISARSTCRSGSTLDRPACDHRRGSGALAPHATPSAALDALELPTRDRGGALHGGGRPAHARRARRPGGGERVRRRAVQAGALAAGSTHSDNMTVRARGPGVPPPPVHDKTSIVCSRVTTAVRCSLPAGVAARAINLSKLDGAPPSAARDYCFLIDFEGHVDDEVVATASGAGEQEAGSSSGFYPVAARRRRGPGAAPRPGLAPGRNWVDDLRGQVRAPGEALGAAGPLRPHRDRRGSCRIELRRLRDDPTTGGIDASGCRR